MQFVLPCLSRILSAIIPDELLLTCCLIRYQGVMTQVMGAHIELYGKTIHERVRSEVGGKYKTLLLQVLNVAWPES